MTHVGADAPLRSDRRHAAECLNSDASSVLGDEVGVHMSRGPAIRQQVAIELGPAEVTGDTTQWMLRWEPVGHKVVLPAFTGALEIGESSDGAATLRVTGAYRPPLGLVGVIVDGAIGHRLAEASIEHFVSGVARRLDKAAVVHGRSWRESDPAPDLRPA